MRIFEGGEGREGGRAEWEEFRRGRGIKTCDLKEGKGGKGNGGEVFKPVI